MGFICPICEKDFGNNKEWFDDHKKAHEYDLEYKERFFIVKKEQNIANLKSIQNAIKSDRIRIWMNMDGDIVFMNTKTGNEITVKVYYDMNKNKVEQ